jgi:hypothetical protein
MVFCSDGATVARVQKELTFCVSTQHSNPSILEHKIRIEYFYFELFDAIFTAFSVDLSGFYIRWELFL